MISFLELTPKSILKNINRLICLTFSIVSFLEGPAGRGDDDTRPKPTTMYVCGEKEGAGFLIDFDMFVF